MTVGPHPQPWPDDPRLDPELLAHGDSRNVADRYRYWTVEAIAADLAAHRAGRASQLHVAIENLEHDLNIGSIVRTANAFNAATVHVVGRRRWNRRGAMVTDAYLDVRHQPDSAALARWARSEHLSVIGVDVVPGAVPIETYPLPQRCLLLFGQEGPGLTAGALDITDAVVMISQDGSTRSINVAAAAAIAMYSWRLRHSFGTAIDG